MKSKLKFAIPLALLTCFALAHSARAAWMEEFTGNTFAASTTPSGPFGSIEANLSFAVFDNSTGATAASVPMAGGAPSVDVAAGQFGYFYQLVNMGSSSPLVVDFDVSTTGVSLTSIDVVDGSVFADESDGFGERPLSATGSSDPANLGLGTDSTPGSPLNVGDSSELTTVAGATVSPFSFTTDGLIARATFLPFGFGTGAVSSILYFTSASKPVLGDVLINVPSAPGTVAVPVPTPSAFGLILAAIPLAVFVRKRRASGVLRLA